MSLGGFTPGCIGMSECTCITAVQKIRRRYNACGVLSYVQIRSFRHNTGPKGSEGAEWTVIEAEAGRSLSNPMVAHFCEDKCILWKAEVHLTPHTFQQQVMLCLPQKTCKYNCIQPACPQSTVVAITGGRTMLRLSLASSMVARGSNLLPMFSVKRGRNYRCRYWSFSPQVASNGHQYGVVLLLLVSCYGWSGFRLVVCELTVCVVDVEWYQYIFAC